MSSNDVKASTISTLLAIKTADVSITYSTLSFTTYSDDISSGVIGYSTGSIFITNTKMFSVIEA